MRVEKYYWKRTSSVELYGKLYIPDGRMSVLVIMVHGIGEHGECYDEWAKRFALQSFGFLMFDMRGHGRSSGIRGHVCIDAVKDDIRVIVSDMQKKFADIPIVLFGYSLGGQIVLSQAIDGNVMIRGVIASSPLLKLVKPPSLLLVRLAKFASYIMPWFTVKTGIKAGQLSRDGNSAKSTKTDPLLHKKISVKLFSDLYAGGEIILRNKCRPDIPVLLMHGDADPLVSYEAVKQYAQNAGKTVTFKKWQGMYHDLLNDVGNEVVFYYTVKWLSKYIIEDGTVQNSRKMYRVA